jgi:predicted nucleic acid-binding Zn ribbon protein
VTVPVPTKEACPLCGGPVGSDDARCPDCNMTLAGVGRRPPAFTRQSLWFWAGALLVIYLVVLAIVVLAR